MILYDFADLDDYEGDEEEEVLPDGSLTTGTGASAMGSGNGSPSSSTLSPLSSSGKLVRRHLWKRRKGSKEGKIPCVRLMSGMHRDGEAGKDGDDDGGGGGGGGGGAGSTSVDGSGSGSGSGACGEQWVKLPTVAVLLESLGKVRRFYGAGVRGEGGGLHRSGLVCWSYLVFVRVV